MHSVAHHLQKVAMGGEISEPDTFARSAYNRYYYAVFLLVREMLKDLDSNWSKVAHKSYPEILKGQISKSYKSAMKRALKNGDNALVPHLDTASRSALALASLMEKANGVRVVADYEPSELVNFDSSQRFSLKGIEITEAHSWINQVNVWIDDIKRAWVQINV